MKSIYIETTVVGHIVGRLHPDTVILGRQMITRRWWDTANRRYKLDASNLVIAECAAVDTEAGRERLVLLAEIDLLDIDEETEKIASALLANHGVPKTEPRDATHIAVVAVNGIDYLATWNFKHIMKLST